jgi:SAM-dependent methyltransferase
MAMNTTLQALRALSHQRLHPSLTDPNWLVLRERRRIFTGWIQKAGIAPIVVLDLGGRIQPYRPLLEERAKRYIAVDVTASALVDIVARGEELPLPDEHIDVVICTQVLEYIHDPQLVVAEMYRVLKPGGILLLTVPAIFPRDADHDCWRFMPESLRYLLRRFSEVEIEAEGSSVVGIFRTFAVVIATYTKPSWLATLFRWTLVPISNLAAVAVASVIDTKNDQFSANFAACAQK